MRQGSNEERPPAAQEDRPVEQHYHDQDKAKGAGPVSKPAQSRGCVSFSRSEDVQADGSSCIAELVYALAENKEAGRMAVLKAVAAKAGFRTEEEIRSLLDGKSKKKVHAPQPVRELVKAMDLDHVLAPTNLVFATLRPPSPPTDLQI